MEKQIVEKDKQKLVKTPDGIGYYWANTDKGECVVCITKANHPERFRSPFPNIRYKPEQLEEIKE